MSTLEDLELSKLISQLQRAIENPTEERDPQELFEYAIWTVNNIDKVVQSATGGLLGVTTEERKNTKKIDILNTVCFEVSSAWQQIDCGTELEQLGEHALILLCDELDKLNALS